MPGNLPKGRSTTAWVDGRHLPVCANLSNFRGGRNGLESKPGHDFWVEKRTFPVHRGKIGQSCDDGPGQFGTRLADNLTSRLRGRAAT